MSQTSLEEVTRLKKTPLKMHLQSAFHPEELLHPRAHAVRYHCKAARKPPLMLTARHQRRGSAETGHRLHLGRYEGICPPAAQPGGTRGSLLREAAGRGHLTEPPGRWRRRRARARPHAPHEGSSAAAVPRQSLPGRKEKGEGERERGEGRRGAMRAGPTRGAPPEARRRPREGSAEGGGRGGKWRRGAEGSGALTSAGLRLGSAGGRSAPLRAEAGPARRSPRPAPAPSFTCRLPRPCPGRREPGWRWKAPPRGSRPAGLPQRRRHCGPVPPGPARCGHESQPPAPGLCHPLRAGAPHTEGASQPLGPPADSRVSRTELGACLEDAKAEGKAAHKRSCL